MSAQQKKHPFDFKTQYGLGFSTQDDEIVVDFFCGGGGAGTGLEMGLGRAVNVAKIHYSPKARKRAQLDAKLHWNAVTPDNLTKSFAQARDDSKAYEELPPGERPTFHEIRALGAWLYEQQNFAQEYIQGLMGHADVKMTKHYQAGHGG